MWAKLRANVVTLAKEMDTTVNETTKELNAAMKNVSKDVDAKLSQSVDRVEPPTTMPVRACCVRALRVPRVRGTLRVPRVPRVRGAPQAVRGLPCSSVCTRALKKVGHEYAAEVGGRGDERDNETGF